MKVRHVLTGTLAAVALTFTSAGVACADDEPADTSSSLSEVTGIEGADAIAEQYDLHSVEVVEPGSFDRIEVSTGSEDEPLSLTPRIGRSYNCVAPGGAQVSCKDGTGHTVLEGPKSKMTLGYSWNTHSNSSSNANVIGRGFQNGKQVWRGGGNAKSGSFKVPWYAQPTKYTKPGNGQAIMAVKNVKVRSMNPPAGVAVVWG